MIVEAALSFIFSVLGFSLGTAFSNYRNKSQLKNESTPLPIHKTKAQKFKSDAPPIRDENAENIPPTSPVIPVRDSDGRTAYSVGLINRTPPPQMSIYDESLGYEPVRAPVSQSISHQGYVYKIGDVQFSKPAVMPDQAPVSPHIQHPINDLIFKNTNEGKNLEIDHGCEHKLDKLAAALAAYEKNETKSNLTKYMGTARLFTNKKVTGYNKAFKNRLNKTADQQIKDHDDKGESAFVIASDAAQVGALVDTQAGESDDSSAVPTNAAGAATAVRQKF